MRTYGRLEASELTWIISDLEPHVAIRLKRLFPRVPVWSRGPYSLPVGPQMAADLDWFMSRYPLAAAPQVLADVARLRGQFERSRAEVGRIQAEDWTPPPFVGLKPGQEVRPHQARNVELLRMFGGLLVGDAIGKGKTYTGGAACLMPGALPATIVCPPHLKGQWKRKLEEFTTLRVCVINGTRPYELPVHDVRVLGYTQIAGWIDVIAMLGTGLLIIEEGHALRRGVGTRYQPVAKGVACLALSELAPFRLMLTGTPVFNYGDETWHLMRYVRPEVLGEEEDFLREWCSGRVVGNPEALGTYLREMNAFVREPSDFPDPVVITVGVDHDVERIESVRELAEALALKAVRGTFHERGEARRELALRLRMETGIAKAPAVAKYVRMVVEGGQRVVLFGWHREVYDIWQATLGDLGVAMYTGSESPAAKARAIARFQAGEAGVLIMSLRSGEGVDGLQHFAGVAVIGELDWSPKVHEQCIGRLNREGQPRWHVGQRVEAIYLLADDGSDPPMVSVLGLKASQSHAIVDPGLPPQQQDQAAAAKAMEALVHRYLKREGVAA